MTTTLQTAGAAMDSADALKELIARQAVEIEKLRNEKSGPYFGHYQDALGKIARLEGHIKHIGNDALRSEVERLRKDAERYRWLRTCQSILVSILMNHHEELDAAIDAAIQKETP
jgi:hypothetical protein